MGTRVRFHFDPRCPWAWQSSKWMRAAAELRDIEVEWRLFSLQIINAPKEDSLADPEGRGTVPLRTLALARKLHGNDAMDRLYVALGERVHEHKQDMDPATVRAALVDAGLEAGLVDEALADPSTIADVKADHDAAVEDVGAFGVPTIVLPSGKGIFGPVVSKPPEGAASGELWDRVEWFIEQDGFYELKRARDKKPGE